jgi:hypothetical protein
VLENKNLINYFAKSGFFGGRHEDASESIVVSAKHSFRFFQHISIHVSAIDRSQG